MCISVKDGLPRIVAWGFVVKCCYKIGESDPDGKILSNEGILAGATWAMT